MSDPLPLDLWRRLQGVATEMASDKFWRDMARPIQASLRYLKDEVEAMDSVSRKEYRKQAVLSLEAAEGEMAKAAENGLFVSELSVVRAALKALRGDAGADQAAQAAAGEHDSAVAARAEQKAGQQQREQIFQEITGSPAPPPPAVAAGFDQVTARETPFTWTQDDEGTVTVLIAVPPECKKSDVSVVFAKEHLKVSVGGHPLQPVIDADLLYGIISGDSSWALEGSGSKRKLVVSMEKSQAELQWEGLVDNDEGRKKKDLSSLVAGMGVDGMKKWGED
uniref:CS domain-containing protein n=1 Tax=Haptolina brevifila TaxID=156173 RepID=A0A7S2DDL9_9EUKA